MAKPPAGRPAGVPTPYRRRGSKKWQIKLTVPKGAGGPLQIARTLDTTDYAEALRRAVVLTAKLRLEIEARRRNADGTRTDLKGSPSEAQREVERWWSDRRIPHPTEPGIFTIPEKLEDSWDHDVASALGDPSTHDKHETYQPEKRAAAMRLVGVVLGGVVPVGADLDRYITLQGLKASYASRTRRSVGALALWLAGRTGGDNIHLVSGKAAVAFADHLAETRIATSTLNSLTSALSAYWDWLVKRHVAGSNPWTNQTRRVVDRERNAEKRPFTDAEVVTLLAGPASATLHDLMRLAALTGMRLTEIGGLRVKGAKAGVFQVEESKTASGVRAVPVHPDLMKLVERRVRGKGDQDFLIEELTSPPSHGGARGRKMGAKFTAYRRDLGLDERRSGRRQADADFHSFRRWFVTKAEQAGQDQGQVARVVGHKQVGFTFATYSGGATIAQSLDVVKAVRLPKGAPVDSPSTPIRHAA